MCLHPDLCYLAGEEEPYYKLADNGYPRHQSDEFHTVNNPDLVRLLIANELCDYNSANNRRLLQESRVEEPPYVEPIQCRTTDTLVLKTPQNCYRRGVLELLYPGSEVVYLRLWRDSLAIINGLMDGWLGPDFTARLTPQGWWKFDMPPNWSWEPCLLERCINQWRQATKFINQDYADAVLDVHFEEFIEDWVGVCKRVWDKLGLTVYTPPEQQLPKLMATDPPGKDRWRYKRPWLAELGGV